MLISKIKKRVSARLSDDNKKLLSTYVFFKNAKFKWELNGSSSMFKSCSPLNLQVSA